MLDVHTYMCVSTLEHALGNQEHKIISGCSHGTGTLLIDAKISICNSDTISSVKRGLPSLRTS